jgi:tetratricopeptide (TPR) repeat protein
MGDLRRVLAILLLCLVPGAALAQGAPNAIERALALERLASDTWNKDPWPTQIQRLEEALALLVPLIGERDPRSSAVRRTLGHAFHNSGRYEESAAVYRTAAESVEWARGPNDLTLGIYLGDLAAALREQGKLDEAEPVILRSLAIRRAHLPANDGRIAGGLINLGRLYLKAGRSAEAVAALREAERIYVATLGTDHPQTVATRNLADSEQYWLWWRIKRYWKLVAALALVPAHIAFSIAMIAWERRMRRRGSTEFLKLVMAAPAVSAQVAGWAAGLFSAVFVIRALPNPPSKDIYGLIYMLSAVVLIMLLYGLLGLMRHWSGLPWLWRHRPVQPPDLQPKPLSEADKKAGRVSVKHAMVRGHLLVTVPVLLALPVIVLPLVLLMVRLPPPEPWATILGLSAVLGMFPLIIAVHALTSPRWRLWALQTVNDWPALRARAVAVQLLYPSGHWMRRLEIMSRRHRDTMNRLEAWRDQHG